MTGVKETTEGDTKATKATEKALVWCFMWLECGVV